MSTEFKREERYIVFKLSDVERYLTAADRSHLAMMKNEIDAGRDCANKPPFKGLIVESDWPEYEPTWKAIEARVTGAQSVPEESAIQTAARIMNLELIRERDALRSKIEEMEQQEPIAKVRVHRTGGNAGIAWSVAPLNDFDSLPLMRDGDRLYALPGAQNATKAVAYLDLGVGGYMDVGTDLTDEELAALPKGRHMLGIIGTYGVDGYVPARPAPSVPDDILRDAVRYRFLRAAKNIPISSKAAHDPVVYDEAIDAAMLAAAPEAKP